MLNWNDPRLARLERSGRAAWIWDPRGRRILWATAEAARLWGLDDDFLLIDRPFGATDPTAADLDLAANALSHAEGIDTEVRLVHSGRTRIVPVMARRFARTAAGDLVLFTAAPRAAEAHEQAPQHPVAPLFNPFPLGLALFTPVGQLIYANPVFERMIGRGQRAVLADVLGSEAGAQRFIRALLAAGTVRVTPTLQLDGRETTLQIDAALAEDPRSKRSALFIEIHDVTARRMRERGLAERALLLKDLLDEAIEGWAVLDRRENILAFGGRMLEDAPGADDTIGLAWRDAARTFELLGEGADEAADLARRELRLDIFVAHERASLESVPAYGEDGDFIGYHVFLRTRGAPQRAAEPAAAPPAAQEPPDLALLPVVAHDNFEIVYANELAARLFGYDSASALIGRPFLDLFPEDERRASLPYDDLSRDPDAARTARLQARTAGGETRYLEATFRMGKIAGREALLAGFTDVTALIEAEDGGGDHREESLPLFEAAPHPLLLIDRNARIARANAQAARFLGLSEGELLERPFEDLIDKADRTAFEIRRLGAHANEGEVPGLEVRLRTRAGTAEPALLRVRALAGDGAMLVGITDLSAQRAREAELSRAVEAAEERNRQKTSFLSATSHEMRTPLNAIIGFSEFMREGRLGPIGNEKYAGYVNDILMSGQHLLSLVNDLLDMSKIEAGALELSFAPVDVTTVAEQCLRIISPQAEKKGVILAGSLPRNLPKVVADARSLRQILLNLLSNAVKFTQGTGRVLARASFDPARGVVIEIEDSGIGMSQAELATALQPFRQIRGRAANDELGTGLGLPLAKALAEANHASFRITSEPDKGTRVELVFPLSQTQAENAAGA